MRIIFSLLLVLTLVTCGKRGEFLNVDEISPEKAAIALQTGSDVPIFVATSRKMEAGDFGFERSLVPSFLRYDVNIPKDHQEGEVSWARNAKRADPLKNFMTREEMQFEGAKDFRRALQREMAEQGQQEVFVYIHGYNTNLAEGVYRIAQMHHDLGIPGAAVHYSWPSRASAMGYVYDRDSSLFARDGLETLLSEVAAAGASRIVVVAHSMGSALTMETMRQVALAKNRKVLDRLVSVVLISPDLDVDLFRAQAFALNNTSYPIVIYGNSKDTILNLSSRLSGRPDRLGNLENSGQVLAGLNVQYIDTSAFSEGAGHFNVATSPTLISLLNGLAKADAAFRAEGDARVGLLPGALLTVQRAGGVVLAPVEGLASGEYRQSGRRAAEPTAAPAAVIIPAEPGTLEPATILVPVVEPAQ